MECKRAGVVFLLAGAVLGCQSPPPPSRPPVPDFVEPWRAGTYDPRAKEPALLWNGLVGLRVGRDGLGNGLPSFSIDDYEPSGEEKIRENPNPLGGQWTANGQRLDPTKGEKYVQSIDFRDGILTTEWVQTVGASGVRVRSQTVLHPDRRVVGQSWSFLSKDPLNLKFIGPETEVQLPLTAGKEGNWYRRVAFGDDPVNRPPSTPNFPAIADASRKQWAKRWETDIEIDGPPEDQQAIRSFLFYLRSAIHSGGGRSISPFGLSDRQYNGHVFWDADIWVFPALALVDPVAAREISRYRLAMAPQALKNETAGAIRYPWESSVTGRETVPGPSQKELHITGSALFGLRQARALDLISHAELWANGDLLQAGAKMYTQRAVKTDRGLELKDVMSPDENHTGDNDLYTNLLAQWLVDGGRFNLKAQSHRFYLPKDGQTLLTYDGDQGRTYKQAAAVLSIYPLQYPPAEREADVMMKRFADKVIKNGPAMSDAVHSVIWSRLGDSDRAYAAWKASWEPFTRHPLMLFSEKRRADKTYFTTGAGGALQSVLFGFMGFRIDWERESVRRGTRPAESWRNDLAEGATLFVEPHMPKQWKRITFRNFWLRGKRRTLELTESRLRMSPGK